MPRISFKKMFFHASRATTRSTSVMVRGPAPRRAQRAGAIVCATVAAFAAACACGAEPDVTPLLRQKDELLLMAVHRGDRATWDNATTPDFAYIEAGEVWPRDVFLNGLEEDGKQPLAIRQYGVHRIGDTAMVIHEDEVRPDPAHASRPGGRFLMTETWQRIAGEWKLRLVHIEPVRSDPPALMLSAVQLDELTGAYRAGAGDLVIRRTGGHLAGTAPGHPQIDMQAEARDVFFTPGDTRMRRIFQRDPQTGAVTGFIQRNENSDVPYVRLTGAEGNRPPN